MTLPASHPAACYSAIPPADDGDGGAADPVAWSGTVAVEGVATGDGRMIEPNAIVWNDSLLPLPLRWARADVGAHDGAVNVGWITSLSRDVTSGRIDAEGTLHRANAESVELAGLMGDGEARGVSVDLDDVDVEVRVAAELLDDPGMVDEGEVVEQPVPDADGRVTVARWEADDELLVTTNARLRAATVVDTPAFVDARIRLADATAPADEDADEVVAAGAAVSGLTAAAAAAGGPPRSWFDPPALDGPTPFTVDDDGRVYGHLALWGTCHTAFQHDCVTAPSSQSGYAYFHVGAVRCDDGSDVPVGRITVDTLHAGRRLAAADTAAHYEHSGLAVADVRAGEDDWGIWVAGALRPGLTDEQVSMVRGAPLSGDWRTVGGSLELVAALGVNSPGFPVPRALVASGRVVALQAAGVVPSDTPATGYVPPSVRPLDLSDEQIAALRRVADREAADDRMSRAAAAAVQVRRARAALRVGRARR